MSRLSALATLALVTCLLPASALAVPNDAEEVRSAVASFSVTWNNHDMVAFGRLFTDDADFVNVQGLLWKGRKEIQMQHAWSHGAIAIDTQGFDAADVPTMEFSKAAAFNLTASTCASCERT